MFENTKILRFAMFANTFLYIFSLLTTAKIVSFSRTASKVSQAATTTK